MWIRVDPEQVINAFQPNDRIMGCVVTLGERRSEVEGRFLSCEWEVGSYYVRMYVSTPDAPIKLWLHGREWYRWEEDKPEDSVNQLDDVRPDWADFNPGDWINATNKNTGKVFLAQYEDMVDGMLNARMADGPIHFSPQYYSFRKADMEKGKRLHEHVGQIIADQSRLRLRQPDPDRHPDTQAEVETAEAALVKRIERLEDRDLLKARAVIVGKHTYVINEGDHLRVWWEDGRLHTEYVQGVEQ